MKARQTLLPVRLLLLIIAVLSTLNIKASYTPHSDFNVDGIYYRINNDGNTVTVTFRGTLTFAGVSHGTYSGDVTIPETVEYDGQTYTVTAIDQVAFYYCNVTSVSLPFTLKTIGLEAFRGCRNLTELVLPNGLERIDAAAFATTGIQSMTLPNSLETLPVNLFRESSITSVKLPSGLKEMGAGIFQDTKITSISIPNGVEEIPQNAFYNTKLLAISLPQRLKKIGTMAFANTSLTNILLPSTVESIGESAFSKSQLFEIDLPQNLVTLGKEAFNSCRRLRNVTFTTSQLTSIGEETFYFCDSLELLGTIPSSVQSIGKSAFEACYSIKSVSFGEDSQLKTIGDNAFKEVPAAINIPPSVETIGALAFCQDTRKQTQAKPTLADNNHLKSIGRRAFYWTKIEKLTMSDNAECIGEGAFGMCKSLKEVTIPANLITIEPYTFKDCTSLQTVTIPTNSKLETIGDEAFYLDKAIDKIAFPNTLKSLGYAVFSGCTQLSEVTFGTGLKSVGCSCFSGCSNITKVDIADLRNWCEVDFDPENSRNGYSIGALALYSNPLVYSKIVVVNGKQLDELILPEGIKKVGLLAFIGCTKFDKVVIPSSVENIGDYAFSGCSDLDNVVFKTPVNLNSIGNGAFYNCTSLQSVNLPNNVTNIGSEMFAYCNNLTSVNLPNQINVIPLSMFDGCSKLSNITIPETVQSIEAYAFRDCSGLTRIDIPAAIKHIGTEAFNDCSNLKGVYIKDMVSWCAIKYDNAQASPNWETQDMQSNPLIFAHNLYLNNELVKNLMVPNGVKTIEAFAFWGAECIESVQFPTGLEKIGNGAFRNCYNLGVIKIPATVTSIDGLEVFNNAGLYQEVVKLYLEDMEPWLANNLGYGFAYTGNFRSKPCMELYMKNKRLVDVVIPQTIKALNKYDFAWMKLNSVTLHSGIEDVNDIPFYSTSVDYIYCQSKFAPNGSNKIFKNFLNQPRLKAIFVPKGRSANYKSKWSAHSDIIKEIEPEMAGTSNASDISEMKAAITAIEGKTTYMDLTGATLDETVTAETLKAGDTSNNVIYYLPEGTGITGDNIVVNGVADNVNLLDGHPFAIPEDFVASNVTYQRSISQSNSDAYTLCLPFDYSLPTGLKAYTLRGKNDYGELVFAEVSEILANKPYLVLVEQTINSLNAQNVTMKATPDTMEDEGNSDFEFRGTLSPISNEDAAEMGAYILQANRKWHPIKTENPTAYIAAGRAYLVPKPNVARSDFSCLFTINEDVTAIKTISKDGSEQYFDLQGHKIDNPTRGIYIVRDEQIQGKNGKKINIK